MSISHLQKAMIVAIYYNQAIQLSIRHIFSQPQEYLCCVYRPENDSPSTKSRCAVLLQSFIAVDKLQQTMITFGMLQKIRLKEVSLFLMAIG